jgi:hypothetical protein
LSVDSEKTTEMFSESEDSLLAVNFIGHCPDEYDSCCMIPDEDDSHSVGIKGLPNYLVPPRQISWDFTLLPDLKVRVQMAVFKVTLNLISLQMGENRAE